LIDSSLEISVGARGSLLSKAQVAEVYQEIKQFYPPIQFRPTWIVTQGDKDQKTSLRTLEKTNFFTDEIDRRQLQGEFQISIHSAKDLPDPLHPDLEIIAITKGVDTSDSLVVRELPLPRGARIGTSSERREAFLKQWRHDLVCVDVRGAVDDRLRLIDDGVLEGVVVAEAALIRLRLTDRLRIHLDIATAPMQGRLAIIARKNDTQVKHIFQNLHHAEQL
jgi:hydroxymethylbilane synthase